MINGIVPLWEHFTLYVPTLSYLNITSSEDKCSNVNTHSCVHDCSDEMNPIYVKSQKIFCALLCELQRITEAAHNGRAPKENVP